MPNSNTVEVRVSPELAGVVALGVVHAEDLLVRPSAPDVEEEAERLAEALRAQYRGLPPSEIEALGPARELFRRVGEDPTKTRPSSEALLRRVLRGEALPRINSLVDAVNLCSLSFLLPIGLYDLDRMHGPVIIRLGRLGEGYDSLGKGFFRAEGRVVVADDAGPFGGPVNDAQRTAVTQHTRRALALVFAPSSYPRAHLEDHTRVLGRWIVRSSSGRIVQAHVLPKVG